METREEAKDKVHFFHSISFKVTLVVVIASMICILANVINAERGAEKAIRALNDEYLLSVASNSAETISNIPEGRFSY